MQFTDTEVTVIQTYVVTTLTSGAVSRLTREDVFNNLHENVGKSLTKGQFLSALGELIRDNGIPGVVIVKGRSGGIKLFGNKSGKSSKAETAEATVSSQTETATSEETEISNDSESL